MNIFQRIVLVLGAIALIIAMLTTPRVMYGSDGAIISHDAQELYAELMPGLATVVDLRTAIARAIAVLVPTILLYWAFKGIGPGG